MIHADSERVDFTHLFVSGGFQTIQLETFQDIKNFNDDPKSKMSKKYKLECSKIEMSKGESVFFQKTIKLKSIKVGFFTSTSLNLRSESWNVQISKYLKV